MRAPFCLTRKTKHTHRFSARRFTQRKSIGFLFSNSTVTLLLFTPGLRKWSTLQGINIPTVSIASLKEMEQSVSDDWPTARVKI